MVCSHPCFHRRVALVRLPLLTLRIRETTGDCLCRLFALPISANTSTKWSCMGKHMLFGTGYKSDWGIPCSCLSTDTKIHRCTVWKPIIYRFTDLHIPPKDHQITDTNSIISRSVSIFFERGGLFDWRWDKKWFFVTDAMILALIEIGAASVVVFPAAGASNCLAATVEVVVGFPQTATYVHAAPVMAKLQFQYGTNVGDALVRGEHLWHLARFAGVTPRHGLSPAPL